MSKLFMDYLRKQWLLGIFLSSGIVRSPDYTMQLLTDTAAILRYRYRYRGYIHLKIIPGASDAAIRHALSLASAVSRITAGFAAQLSSSSEPPTRATAKLSATWTEFTTV